MALTTACHSEYNAFTDAKAQLIGPTEGARQRYRRTRESRQEMIRVSLPLVIGHRAGKLPKQASTFR